MNDMKAHAEMVAEFDNMTENVEEKDEDLVALRKDTDGRMMKALNGKVRFERWGKHYLRSLCRFH